MILLKYTNLQYFIYCFRLNTTKLQILLFNFFGVYIIGIEELFSSESEYVYFIPYLIEGYKVSPNRGKLYDKYCNIKKRN